VVDLAGEMELPKGTVVIVRGVPLDSAGASADDVLVMWIVQTSV
jgi:hypothetical protein